MLIDWTGLTGAAHESTIQMVKLKINKKRSQLKEVSMHYLQILHSNNLHRRIHDLFDIHVKLKKQLSFFFCLSVLPRYG